MSYSVGDVGDGVQDSHLKDEGRTEQSKNKDTYQTTSTFFRSHLGQGPRVMVLFAL